MRLYLQLLQVCCMEPLVSDQLSGHSLYGLIFFAMASLSRLVIASLRPELKVHFSQRLDGAASTFPLVSWRIVSVRHSASHRTLDPVLAFARDNSVYFVQVGLISYDVYICIAQADCFGSSFSHRLKYWLCFVYFYSYSFFY